MAVYMSEYFTAFSDTYEYVQHGSLMEIATFRVDFLGLPCGPFEFANAAWVLAGLVTSSWPLRFLPGLMRRWSTIDVRRARMFPFVGVNPGLGVLDQEQLGIA